MKQSFPVIDKILVLTLFLFTASSMFSISISQVSAGVGGFFWLLRTHLTDTWKEQRWPLGIPFVLFVLACLTAVVNAYDVNYSYKSLKKLVLIVFEKSYKFNGLVFRVDCFGWISDKFGFFVDLVLVEFR